jgi:hypothetical protein
MRQTLFTFCFYCLLFANKIYAFDIDKVYHPYVEQDVFELEYRRTHIFDADGMTTGSRNRISFGHAFTEKLFIELYLSGKTGDSEDIAVDAYEIEGLYQVGEQGEYWLDSGFVFEIEKERHFDEWEAKMGFLFEKEWGRFSHTLNLIAKYEFEDDVKREWGGSSAYQFRYRWQPQFEPGIEIYNSSPSLAVGPMFQGIVKFGVKQLHWELAILKEFRDSPKPYFTRALIEWEF